MAVALHKSLATFESMASANAERFAAMESARGNVEK
jgi:F0F1-type ATP synthase gamma subunit